MNNCIRSKKPEVNKHKHFPSITCEAATPKPILQENRTPITMETNEWIISETLNLVTYYNKKMYQNLQKQQNALNNNKKDEIAIKSIKNKIIIHNLVLNKPDKFNVIILEK